ncbi:MAG: glycosyltransferase family 2 protein [Planctomycetota bacterium]
MALRVSVCIPTYNSAATLPAAIQSVLAQRLTDFELLISDNASSDATADIVKRFRDPRIRYHRHSRNLGYTRNVRFCIEASRAEVVGILCADDYWEPDYLSSLLPSFEESPWVTLAYSACTILDQTDSGRGDRFIPLIAERPTLSDGATYALEEFRHGYTILSGHLFRRSVALATGSFADPTLRLLPDLLHRLRVAARGRVAYVPRPLAVYRVHPTNLSAGTRSYDWWREELHVRRRMALDPRLRACRRGSLRESFRDVLLSLLCVHPDVADSAERLRTLLRRRPTPWGCPEMLTKTSEPFPDIPPASGS